MKKIKEITLLLFCSTLFLFPFISSATCATTHDDTTFGVDIGDELVWTFTSGSPDILGFKYNLTIEDIYTGNYMTVDSYMIDATMGKYNKTEATWVAEIDDAFYVAANETQNFLQFAPALSAQPLWFTIPTPINLTMLGEFAVDTGFYSNFTVNGNRLDIDSSFIGTYRITYNSDGIITRHVSELFGIVVGVMTLGEGGGDAIPFGYFFLIFTIIGTIALIYLERRKIK